MQMRGMNILNEYYINILNILNILTIIIILPSGLGSQNLTFSIISGK